jgi:8-oxo-dGTP pyrophosphatase MutT (NUDIX family)
MIDIMPTITTAPRTVIATSIDGAAAKVYRKDLIMRVHVYAIIVRDNKVLISPQWEHNGFVFPGGSIEMGENHLDGLVRELLEETGYEVKPRKVVDVFTTFYMNFKTKKAQHSTLIYYDADVIKGRLSTDGFDKHELEYASKARWVTLEQLKTLKFTCNTQEPIKAIIKYLEGRMTSAPWR